MRKVSLGQALEGRPQHLPDVLDLEVLVSDLDHLQERTYYGVVGLGRQGSNVAPWALLLRDVVVYLFLYFGVEDYRQFVFELRVGIFQEGNGGHLVVGECIGFNLVFVAYFF